MKVLLYTVFTLCLLSSVSSKNHSYLTREPVPAEVIDGIKKNTAVAQKSTANTALVQGTEEARRPEREEIPYARRRPGRRSFQ